VEVIIELPKGAIVSRASDGTIFITSGARGPRQVETTNPVGLLPVLELGPDSISAAADTLPISEVLSLALTRGTNTDYWPRLAVEWLSRTGVPAEVKTPLEAFAHSDRGSQQTRHAARRLLREAD